MIYKHTQIGYLEIFIILATIIIFGIILIQAEFDTYLFSLIFFVLLILVSFVSLTVSIDEKYLRIKFGYGLYKKRVVLNQIISARAVKNHWYYGWGIRIWFWPYMWIYNVSGFNAVEIKMKNNKIYRIGTDEPKRLEQAILKAIKSN